MAESPSTLMLMLRLGLSLGLVLAIVAVVTWVLRRRGLLSPSRRVSSGRLEVLDRKSLGKHASLVVARVGGVAVLVGVTDQQVNVLSASPGIDAAWSEPDPATAQFEADPATVPSDPATAQFEADPATAPSDVVELERLWCFDAAGETSRTPSAPATAPATHSAISGGVGQRLARRLVTMRGADGTTMETRRTGFPVDAAPDAAAPTTTSGMSLSEALRELTVRRS